jgi:dTDP-glucose 4,6-dehydratase
MAGERTHVLVTGGAGFIGSHLVDLLLERTDTRVTVLDKLTYAGTMLNLRAHEQDPRFRFELGDVTEPTTVDRLVATADVVVHAAAESFVDRSIDDSRAFVLSNVLGTEAVLQACRVHATALVFVSTDEVYGSNDGGPFSEDDPIRPTSPYAATKAGADLLCRSYRETYGMSVAIVRGTNAYGPRQHPEKAIPTFAVAALQGRPIPVYGDGSQRREWLYVRDFVRAIATILERGDPAGVYNIGGGHEITNLELARRICSALGLDPSAGIATVPDRPAHDVRYGVGWDRLREIGWRPVMPFDDGLTTTLAWYRANLDWVAAILEGARA